jgi:uncharacterized protein YndB with AHSA1/START domain
MSSNKGTVMAAERRKSVTDNELLIVRTFDAPPAVVFALWSKAEHMKRWMGPKNFTCPQAMIDFSVGGAYRGMIKSAGHGENWFGGVYREIVQDKRLVFTFTWDNEGPSAGIETLITITLEERGVLGSLRFVIGYLSVPRIRPPHRPPQWVSVR